MVEAMICTPDFQAFFDATILPLVAAASVVTGFLIAFSYMLGNLLNNPKLTVWAKTEVLQVFISVASVFFIFIAINTFCAINMGEVASFFTGVETQHDLNVYDAAGEYLAESALYSHNALTVIRYHLQAYTIYAYLNAFLCDFEFLGIGLGCWYGYSGKYEQPLGGYGAINAALNMVFNSTLIAHFSALNFLFILLFVYKGFVFIFLPMGVFLRSMPYMRSFGSLLIAVALSFLIVYPLMLSIYYLMGDVLVDRPDSPHCLSCSDPCPHCYTPSTALSDKFLHCQGESCEKVFDDWASAGIIQSIGTMLVQSFTFGQVTTEDTMDSMYFPDGEHPKDAITFGAYAFIAAVFMPTAALLATIASVSYIARLYGEEINLSRITQLV
ncbi:hypothetical protein GF318_01290 [Candidatus Micrarchaeota archaeon]|nr:hypothetical protein [Candidatus Micrarchaeota archaeon]